MAPALTPEGAASGRHYEHACKMGDRIVGAYGDDMPLPSAIALAHLHATLALVMAVRDLHSSLTGGG